MADEAIQILGGYGYVNEYHVETHLSRCQALRDRRGHERDLQSRDRSRGAGLSQSGSIESLALGPLQLHALDGGALSFAIPGRQRRIELAVRPVLVESPHGSVLYDTGFGDADVQRRQKFRLREPWPLEEQLQELGLEDAPDIVVLSHLHFDHAGGALRGEGDTEQLRFPSARHVMHREEWTAGLADGRGSDLAARLQRAGAPELLGDEEELLPGLLLTRHRGHTEGLLVLQGTQSGASFLLSADLVPTRHFLYPRQDRVADQDPELALSERTALLDALFERDGVVGLYHDRDHAFGRLSAREGGGYALRDE